MKIAQSCPQELGWALFRAVTYGILVRVKSWYQLLLTVSFYCMKKLFGLNKLEETRSWDCAVQNIKIAVDRSINTILVPRNT
jgi:hypothetical protein